MSMADPFLSEQGVTQDDGRGAAQPEDFDREGESEPDVLSEPPGNEAPATDDGEPPVVPTVFNTPTGESVDPSQLG